MIIKRLFSIEKWQVLKVNQLRVELKSRNLPIYGLKDQLIQRIVDYENNPNKQKIENEKPESSMEGQSLPQDLPKVKTIKRKQKIESLIGTELNDDTQSLSIDSNKSFNFAQHPDPYVQSVLNKQKLSEEIDLKDLIKYYEMNDENIASDVKLWELIDCLSKLHQLSLYNFSILQSIDRRKLKGLLKKIPFTKLDACKGVKILRAMSTIEHIDYISYESERADEKWLSLISKHIFNSINEIDLLDLAFIRSYRRDNFEIPQDLVYKLFETIREKFKNVSDFNNYTEQELFTILKQLPAQWGTTNNTEISSNLSKVISLIYEKFQKVGGLDALLAVRTIDSYGLPVPTQLSIEVNRMQKEELLKKASNLKLIMEICFILHKNNFLSQDFLNELIRGVGNFISAGEKEGILMNSAEFFYKLSQSKPYPPKIELKQFIEKVLDFSSNQYSANTLMLLAISSLQADAQIEDLPLDLANKLTLKLQESPRVQVDRFLSEQLLWKILDMAKEKPIFNYQIESSLRPIDDEIKELAAELFKNLKDHPECINAAHEFYLSMLTDTIPPLDFLLSTPKTSKEVDSYTKLIWVYQAHLAPKKLFEVMWSLVSTLDKDYINPETLFYLSSLHSQLSRLKEKDGVNLNGIKKVMLSLIESIQENPYALAIQYNLYLIPSQSNHKLITQTKYQNLYGEALINTIIMLGKIGEYKTAARLSENLSYIPKKCPPIPNQVIKELIRWFSKLASHDLQYEPLTMFLENYLTDENPDLVKLISQFIEEHVEEDDISLEFKEKFEKFKENIPEESKAIEPDEEIKELINFSAIDINYNTIPILQTLLSKRIYIKDLPRQLSKLLNDTTNQEELFEVIKKILDYLSVVGDNERIVDEIYNKIDSLKLWSEVPQEVITNILFLNLDKLGNFTELIKKFLHAIYIGEPVESPVLNPKSNMFCFQPFLLNSELEPRYVQSNFKRRRNSEYSEISKISKMSDSHIAYNWRVHAILNAIGENPTEESLQAVAYQYMKWDKKLPRREFKKEFLKYLGEQKKFKKELGDENQDPVTKWKGDVIFMKYNTVVLYASHEYMVYDENGEELGTTYPIKVIQDQLEKIGNLRCITVSEKDWKEMDPDARKQYVKNLDIDAADK